jgi:hypothetical protein
VNALYSELEPYPAAWLGKLIAAGQIALLAATFIKAVMEIL